MASRKEEKEQRRRERLEKERALEQQSRQRRLYTIVAGGVLSIAAVAWAFPTVAAGGALPAAAGALALALASPVAVWTIGGLESPLVAGLLAWSVALALELLRDGATRRDAFAPSLLLVTVLTGTTLASDRLFVFVGVVPFALTGVLLFFLPRLRAIGAAVVGSALVAFLIAFATKA